MDELSWASSFVGLLQEHLCSAVSGVDVVQLTRLPYGYEVLSYEGTAPSARHAIAYQTDVLVIERSNPREWTPRVVIEMKLASVTTHDAITYSQKAAAHKQVHPYLRYGIMLGSRRHHPLPGRLFRHGAFFDFMLSWADEKPTQMELDRTVTLLSDEVRASRDLQEIIYESRSPSRPRYTLLHRRLELQ